MSSFDDISFDIAQRFLQTVVVVDDRASYTEVDAPPSTIIEPDPLRALPEREVDAGHPVTSDDARHSLDAKEMVDVFATQGLVCAIIRPESLNEPTPERTKAAAERADVVVLDWQIKGDNGSTAKRTIRRIVETDQGRLRLIAIYTGDLDLARIADSIEADLKEAHYSPERSGDDTCTIHADSVRVEVFSKGGNPRYNDRSVPLSALPQRLVKCFAELTSGLVSNAAVDAVSAVRANTHKLLSNLHKDLSGAYLVQRALTKPEDAFEFLSNLISEELRSILSEQDAEEEHDRAVLSWLANNDEWQKAPALREVSASLSTDDLFNLMVQGTPLSLDRKAMGRLKRKISVILSGEDAHTRNVELAVLSTSRSRYGNSHRRPILTLGTVLSSLGSGGNTEYFVCIQPRCDSVRLTDASGFTFLQLKPCSSEQDFSFIVPRDGKFYVYLKVIPKTSAVRILHFRPRPEDGGIVRAILTDHKHTLQAEDGHEYFWEAELKDGYAQRIVQQFASHLSRVGLNEHEWLRLSDAGELK